MFNSVIVASRGGQSKKFEIDCLSKNKIDQIEMSKRFKYIALFDQCSKCAHPYNIEKENK